MKKKLPVIFKEEANIEIIKAYIYYENESEGLGERFLNELDKIISLINLTPKGYQKFHTYRQIPLDIFPYVVLLEVIEKEIIVFAVFQTQQNPKKKIR